MTPACLAEEEEDFPIDMAIHEPVGVFFLCTGLHMVKVGSHSSGGYNTRPGCERSDTLFTHTILECSIKTISVGTNTAAGFPTARAARQCGVSWPWATEVDASGRHDGST